ncbi:Jitterbug [Operophtera brumata]|uniref:Jitterbug n=1 Tax=Operophtera brumata TaxID=104452 RepID=A0A0L7L862_OPEBR|nr:Jitterbug [Operophtera brumata]
MSVRALRERTLNCVKRREKVLHLSKAIAGSPYTCESFDPNRVILAGLPTGNIVAQTPINFTGKYYNFDILNYLRIDPSQETEPSFRG